MSFLCWFLLIAGLVLLILWFKRRKKKTNVFLTPIITDPPRMDGLDEEELITRSYLDPSSQEELKPYLNNSKKKFHTIVVGSGISGLTSSSLIAQAGKSVLLLEQGEQLGGWIHSFDEEGFRFLPGINYLPMIHDGSLHKVFLDKVSECKINLTDYGELIDTVFLNNEKVEVKRGEMLKEYLLERFPDESKSIEKYFRLMKRIMRQQINVLTLRSFPPWTRPFLKFIFPCKDWLRLNNMSMKSLLDEIFVSEDLKIIAGYMVFHLGDFNSPASIGMMVSGTYLLYGSVLPTPKGCITRKIARTIHKFKGQMYCNATVTDLVIRGGRCVGVKVVGGQDAEEDIFYAKNVITTCGLEKTYNFLKANRISPPVSKKQFKQLVRPSEALFYVFCGFDVGFEELDLPRSHVLVMDRDTLTGIIMTMKNHVHEKESGRSQLMLALPMEYEKVKEWEGLKLKQRGRDYEDLKAEESQKLLDALFEIYPKTKDHIIHCSTGTALTVKHYVGWDKGESMGTKLTKHTLFTTFDKLVKGHGVKGLIISGTDSFFCAGVYSAITTGVISAGEVTGINYIGDAIQAMSERKKVFKMIK